MAAVAETLAVIRSLDDVLAVLRERLPELQDRYRLDRLWVFGSYARGVQRPDSDLDVLVSFQRPPSWADFMELIEALESLTNLRVELVTCDGLKYNPRMEVNVMTDRVAV